MTRFGRLDPGPYALGPGCAQCEPGGRA